MGFIKPGLHGIRLVIVLILFTGFSAAFAYAADSCIDCHKDEKFKVQNQRLFNYFNEWKDSIHNIAGVTCIDCHGGNAQKTAKDAAHKDQFSSLSHTEKDSYKKIPEICGKCHEPVLNNFRLSKHYKTLIEKGNGPHCVTCHGSMNSEVYYSSVIARACQGCHNEYTKNHPEVAGEADKILHSINVSRAFRNWGALYYSEKDPTAVAEINTLYKDVANSWHTFNFEQLDEKSQDLLTKSKAVINRGLAEKRKLNK